MAKKKKADTAGPAEGKKKTRSHKQEGEWTGEQDLALLKLLIKNPSYQETLLHLWLPRNLPHLRKDVASESVVEDLDQSESSTPSKSVTSTLRFIFVHVFGSTRPKCPSQVKFRLRRLRSQYIVQRETMGPEAKRMLLHEMTSDPENSKMAQIAEERRLLLQRYPWWDAFHELVLNHIRSSKECSTEAPTSQPSETLSTGQHPIKEEEREQEEWPSIRTPSVDEGQSDEEDELEDEFEEEPSDAPSQPAESASSHHTQHQQIMQATASTSHSNGSQADTKPSKRAQKKIRSSRQPTSSTATAGRYRHERNMKQTQRLVEREALKRLELEKVATKRLELELKTKESEQSLSFFSERMDAFQSSIMKRLGLLEESMKGE
ncbi:hypothetical protein CF327_g1499 [Tilletia walkeri]|uniref:Uncharacterized protein n=1 Tax=Tilletia walkeri TaxID=117179 RepID=A0A8X7NEI1_9BASI|nr:hypothetical protein CF327_g1499 [Tilletia walkeri]KAE8270501.1 hypothetical protein A4X09_0g1847 [Tilletia walkeri]